MPKRIQRKRTKGWKMPENAVSVTRPGKFGNPFTVTAKRKPGTEFKGGSGVRYFAVPAVEDAIQTFRTYAAMMLLHDPHWLDELRGKDLACWCPLDQPCHADILLQFANKGGTDGK